MQNNIDNEFVFKHEIAMQLRYTDADMQGHINNTIYFQYYNTAYVEYMNSVWSSSITGNVSMVVAHIDADFISSVHIGDNVKVQTAVTHIGNKSFTIIQQLIDADTGEVRCKGKTIMVAFDFEKQQPVTVPEEWVTAMEAFEKRKLRQSVVAYSSFWYDPEDKICRNCDERVFDANYLNSNTFKHSPHIYVFGIKIWKM